MQSCVCSQRSLRDYREMPSVECLKKEGRMALTSPLGMEQWFQTSPRGETSGEEGCSDGAILPPGSKCASLNWCFHNWSANFVSCEGCSFYVTLEHSVQSKGWSFWTSCWRNSWHWCIPIGSAISGYPEYSWGDTQIKPWSAPPIQLADGASCCPLGIIWLSLGFMGQRFYHRFAVLRSLSSPVILWMDFMLRSSVTRHVPSRTVVLRDETASLEGLYGADLMSSSDLSCVGVNLSCLRKFRRHL